MTKLQSGHEKKTPFLTLTFKFDLNLIATDLDLARDTSSNGGEHFHHIIFKSTKE